MTKQALRYRRRMRVLQLYKVAKGCSKCGFNGHPAALHFDHLHDKKFNVPTGLTGNLKTLMAEIRKCQLLCANCHAIKTHG